MSCKTNGLSHRGSRNQNCFHIFFILFFCRREDIGTIAPNSRNLLFQIGIGPPFRETFKYFFMFLPVLFRMVHVGRARSLFFVSLFEAVHTRKSVLISLFYLFFNLFFTFFIFFFFVSSFLFFFRGGGGWCRWCCCSCCCTSSNGNSILLCSCFGLLCPKTNLFIWFVCACVCALARAHIHRHNFADPPFTALSVHES